MAGSSNTADQNLHVHIRWMIRKDMPEVLRIERQVFENPWSETDFVQVLRQRNQIGMVAEIGQRIEGYMIYGLERAGLDLITLAV